MRVGRDHLRDLLQMQAHAQLVQPGRTRPAFAPGRADCPEDVGGGRPLVFGRRGAGPAQRPAPTDPVLRVVVSICAPWPGSELRHRPNVSLAVHPYKAQAPQG